MAAGLGLPESAGAAGRAEREGARAAGLRGWLEAPVPGLTRGHLAGGALAAVGAATLLLRGSGGGGGGGGRGTGGSHLPRDGGTAAEGAACPPSAPPATPSARPPGLPGGFKPQILMFSSSQAGSPVRDSEARRMRHILDARGVPYREVDVCESRGAQSHLKATSGSLTTPQLHAGGQLVGFYEQVQELEDEGALVRELVFLDDEG